MNINSLTPTEEEIMRVIWTLSDPFLRDIMEALPEPKPHQNTVSTYLKILAEKGYLSPKRRGRIFQYHISIEQSTYRREKLLELKDVFYEGSNEELIKDLGTSVPTSSEASVIPTPLEAPEPQPQLPPDSIYREEIAQYVEKLVKNKLKSSASKKKNKSGSKKKISKKIEDSSSKKEKKTKTKTKKK